LDIIDVGATESVGLTATNPDTNSRDCMRCLARADRTGLEKRGRGLEVAAKASAATDYSTPRRRRRRRRRRCGRFTIHDECVKDAASDDGIFGIFVVV